jgi:hypothetical protein
VILIILWFTLNRFNYISIIAVLLYTFFFVYFAIKIPLYTYVDEKNIIVKQLVGKKIFCREEIKITYLETKIINDAIRMFGSGGFGGYIGWFRNTSLGKFYMLSVNTKEIALIETKDGRKYVLNLPKNY